MKEEKKTSHKILRLVKASHQSHVQGLFVMMHLDDLTMNDVQDKTGISRQTLSKWRKGANVTHVNVSRVCDAYNLNVAEIYDAFEYLNNRMANTDDVIEKASLNEFLIEFVYLMKNSVQTEKPNLV